MPTQIPQEPGAIAPGTVVDGRYKVIRGIGQGGNGMVYEVEHARTGRKLALKALLDETGFARLEQEARAASLMKNGHTARIIDMEAGGPTGAYLVMELLEGQSLRGLIDDTGMLPVELTVNIAMQVCECLHEAHGLGIIHRDLKPENVFLCQSPWPGQFDVKVLDFGVMKIAEDGGAIPKSSLTRTGSTVGTPYYMSLEQLRNSSAVDARADVYSLGVVLYECLSGRKPFHADTIGDLVYALCSGPPTQLSRLRPDMDAGMAEVVMRMLSASREERPASMIDLALSLLPHANPAFGLWVKVDGKQPALASVGTGAPRAFSLPPIHPQAAPSPGLPRNPFPRPPTHPPAPPTPGLPRNPFSKRSPAAPTPGLPSSPAAPARTTPPPPGTGGLGPETQQGWAEAKPPRPPSELTERRRDTPTEMYVKSVHDTAGGAENGDAAALNDGDRDTPTRAYVVDTAPPARTQAMPKSPANPMEVAPSPPTSLDPGAALPTPAEVGKTTLPLTGFRLHLPLPPASEAPVQGAASEHDSRSQPSFAMSPLLAEPSPPSSAAPLPRWQERLDRVLIRIGRVTEAQLQRLREAPQNTQIIVVIVTVTVAILLVGFVLFLSVH